jgi:SAM-dependent methyltransferase
MLAQSRTERRVSRQWNRAQNDDWSAQVRAALCAARWREPGYRRSVRMNAFGRGTMNSSFRAFAQRHYLVPQMLRLGGSRDGCRVLELGCGRGVGTELILDEMGAAEVDALDLDPIMVDKARGRLGDRARVEVGDMTDLSAPDASYDAVVDFAAIHLGSVEC